MQQHRSWFLKGNHSFLKFDQPIKIISSDLLMLFKGDCNVEAVLEHLSDFEKKHPDLRVTGWKPETSFERRGAETSVFCFGIWIDHEPREEKQN